MTTPKARNQFVKAYWPEEFKETEMALIGEHLEHHLRILMQDAMKVMRHSKQTRLTPTHVSASLRLHKRGKFLADVSTPKWAGERHEEPLSTILEEPLPTIPRDPTFYFHWISVNGVIPSTVENLPLETTAERKQSSGEDWKNQLCLTQEYKLYLETLIYGVRNNDKPILAAVLKSLLRDAGVATLLPALSKFITEEVTSTLRTDSPDLRLLDTIMDITSRIFESDHLSKEVDPYLNQLLPVIISCIVVERMSPLWSDNHWDVRRKAAFIIELACRKVFPKYPDLQANLVTMMVGRMKAPTLCQLFGILLVLKAMGQRVVVKVVIPRIAHLVKEMIGPHLSTDNIANGKGGSGETSLRQRHEAVMVANLLLEIAGEWIRKWIKEGPSKETIKHFLVLQEVYGERLQLWTLQGLQRIEDIHASVIHL